MKVVASFLCSLIISVRMEGTQQSGVAWTLNVANLATDGQILNIAREAADKILNGRPELVTAPGVGRDRPLQSESLLISDVSLATLQSELKYRFARSVDWSLIS